jgi:hypothetical protein
VSSARDAPNLRLDPGSARAPAHATSRRRPTTGCYFFAAPNLAAANWPMIAASESGWSFIAQ